jgi:hypothetical protein
VPNAPATTTSAKRNADFAMEIPCDEQTPADITASMSVTAIEGSRRTLDGIILYLMLGLSRPGVIALHFSLLAHDARCSLSAHHSELKKASSMPV